MHLNQFDTIFFDFDGVVCDSNTLKRDNIRRACKSSGVGDEKTEAFVTYFTSRNGIPREGKTELFFEDDALSKKILTAYAANNTNLLDAPKLPGLDDFLNITNDKRRIILSGGNLDEITRYLKKHSLEHAFESVLCGPLSKEENLRGMGEYGKAFFIGDSSHDYLVAQSFSLPFIFMFASTQLADWASRDFVNTIVTRDFNTLIKQIT